MSRISRTVADHVLTALDGGIPEGTLNAPRPENDAVQKSLELGRVLGRVAGELVDGAITAVDVEYRGDIADSDVEPLTASVCAGLLDPILDARVNRVSAPELVTERNIGVTEHTMSRSTEFVSEISITASTEDGSIDVAGMLSQSGDPMIVRIDGYQVKLGACDHMIVVYGRDRPGVIGEIGERLAKYDINIAGMNSSRATRGGEAIMLVAVDSPVSPELERELDAIENIIDVFTVTLVQHSNDN